MADHKLNISDDSGTKDNLGDQPEVERKTYIVTDQTVREATEESVGSDGLFKNGKVYKPGEQIELDEQTAASFLANGDIEEA